MPMRKRECVPLSVSISATSMLISSSSGNCASSTTIAVINLVMEAMGACTSEFLLYSGRCVCWSYITAIVERNLGSEPALDADPETARSDFSEEPFALRSSAWAVSIGPVNRQISNIFFMYHSSPLIVLRSILEYQYKSIGKINLLFLLLKIPHLRINSVLRQQFAVRTTLNNMPLVHHQYLVGIHHSGQAVRNDERGTVLRYRAQLGLNRFF